MKPLTPIFVADVLAEMDTELVNYLRTLAPHEWQATTLAPKWTVKDVAVHLLDGNLRTLSMLRDNYYGVSGGNLQGYSDLVDFLNTLNAEWVQAMKRLSPQVVVELLAFSGKAYCELLRTLSPFEQATFAVAWAGENVSANWFHVAREYTEKWHHQQQIRHATGDADFLLAEKWYVPYLDTTVRGLPHHYRNVAATTGDCIKFVVQGSRAKIWSLVWEDGRWTICEGCEGEPLCEVTVSDALAWQIFTKAIPPQVALPQISIRGDKKLGGHITTFLAVMA